MRATLALVIAFTAAVSSCAQSTLDDSDLLAGIEAFERLIEDRSRAETRELLRQHAERYLGQVVHLRSASVASTYVRENRSRIYFGTNYDEADHLYLSELEPELNRRLEDHRYWVSIVKTYPSRQLSFELPVDETTFTRLEPGSAVDLSCRIAALIRGRSVYCVPVDWLGSGRSIGEAGTDTDER